jgi:hypothetical protein
MPLRAGLHWGVIQSSTLLRTLVQPSPSQEVGAVTFQQYSVRFFLGAIMDAVIAGAKVKASSPVRLQTQKGKEMGGGGAGNWQSGTRLYMGPQLE